MSKIELDGTEEDVSFDASELGSMMREMRQAMQRDLKDVAQELRIRRPYLEAIEEGRLDDLPGPAYTTGFLRAYSDYLGLDGEDIVNRFKQAGIDIDRRTNLILPSPLEEGRLPTGSVLLFAALFALVAYAGWYYVSTGDQVAVDQVASIPSEYETLTTVSQSSGKEMSIGDLSPSGAAIEPDAAAIAGATPEETTGTGVAQAPDAAPRETTSAAAETSTTDDTSSAVETAALSRAPTGEPREAPEQVAPEPAPVSRTAVATSPEPQPDPQVGAPTGESTAESVTASAAPETPAASDGAGSNIAPAAETADLRDAKIVIKATEDSWVEVRVGRRKPLLSRLMRQGESFEVASRPGLKMVTGNAGGVAIEVNGTQVPPLGAAGEILQNVAIDAKALLGRLPATP